MERELILSTINGIIENEMHDKSLFVELKDDNDKLSDTGIDSFDFIMVYMKLSEKYKIENKTFKENLSEDNPTVRVLINFIDKYKNL